MRLAWWSFVALLASCASLARADGLPPEIHGVETGNRPERCIVPGQTIGIVGSHLHVCLPDHRCRHDDVSVGFGGGLAAERVLEATADRVVALVPRYLPAGERTITLWTGGRRVTTTLEVVHASDDLSVRDFTWRIRTFELVSAPDGNRLDVVGVTDDRAPDGLSLVVTLEGAQRWSSAADVSRPRLGEAVAPVTSGTFRCSFGPYRGAIPSGVYRVTARFELARQPAALLAPFVSRLAPGEWRALTDLRRSATIVVDMGTPRVHDHRRAHLAALDRLIRELDRMRAAFVLARLPVGRGFDADALGAWVRDRFLPELVAVVQRDRAFREAWEFTDVPADTLAELTYAGLRDLCARAGVPVRDLSLADVRWSRAAFEAERERVRASLRR